MSRLSLGRWFAGLVLMASVARGEDLTSIGVAKVDITPDYPVRMTGFGARTKTSAGVDHPIFAKALAIGTNAEKPAIIVTVDNLGVGEVIVEELAGRLAKEAGIERSRLAVASSHTHSAPALKGIAPHIFGKPIIDEEQTAIDRYTEELTDKLELVCIKALENRAPGRLSWTQGKVTFAFNRRTKGGPVDHALPILRVSGQDGALRALLVNYACHCTTINPDVNKIDGDWAGYAQAAIEADHPGCIAMTSVGCGADSNPIRAKEGSVVLAKAHGQEIAEEVGRLLQGEWKSLSGAVDTSFKRLTLDFDTLPTREELQEFVKKGGAPGYNASVNLAKLDRGEPMQSKLNYSAQAFWFGNDLAMVFLPGEVVVDYVLRLKKEFDPSRLWVSAYSNDLPCYIPSERILKEGGYEGGGAMVYYARPTRLKTGLEQKIIDAVHEVVPAEFLKNAEEAKVPAKP